MLERCVTDAGGTYAMEDTDSMAIVATLDGGHVPCPDGPHAWSGAGRAAHTGPTVPATEQAIHALSHGQADAIAERFITLNPYDRDALPGSILKLEGINTDANGSRQLYCYAISSKRYALFTIDETPARHTSRATTKTSHTARNMASATCSIRSTRKVRTVRGFHRRRRRSRANISAFPPSIRLGSIDRP